MKRNMLQHLDKLSGDAETGMFGAKYGAWQHPVYALAYFPDGKIRAVRLNLQPDTFYSWGGRTSYGRKTVKCFVMYTDGRLMGHYETGAIQEEIR